jgi:hypothetical protein
MSQVPAAEAVLRPKVTIMLDRERHLLFDFNAIAEVEEKFGLNMLNPEIWDKPLGPNLVRSMLWAGLIHEDESLTLQQVGRMIRAANLAAVMKALADAWRQSNPAADEDKPADPPPGDPAVN